MSEKMLKELIEDLKRVSGEYGAKEGSGSEWLDALHEGIATGVEIAIKIVELRQELPELYS